MLSRKEMIEQLEQAEKDKVYFCYGINDFTILSDEKIVELFTQMQNYISDSRTSNID